MRKGCLLCFTALLALSAAGTGVWSVPAEEHFLLTARIVSEKAAGKGLNHTRKAMLTDGRRSHAAHIQSVNISLPLFRGKDGSEERDFQDTWKFNVAAWRLAKLLNLTYMTPACVARVVDAKPSSVCWWIDGVAMDERERLQKHISPPDMAFWNQQMDTIRIFDQLIYNMDRSEENLLITRDWHAWMIDHTRSFRKYLTLRNPAAITHCTPELLRSLRALRRSDVERELSPFLTTEQIDAVMARRDLIVEKLLATRSSLRPPVRP
jgi:hypothetical protein